MPAFEVGIAELDELEKYFLNRHFIMLLGADRDLSKVSE